MHERQREVVGAGACGVRGMSVHRVEVAPVSWQADRAEPRVVLTERGCRVALCEQRSACMRAWFVAALSAGLVALAQRMVSPQPLGRGASARGLEGASRVAQEQLV